MFVWNTFTNDARVEREAGTLIRSGREVWVVAVRADVMMDEYAPRTEEKQGIHVIRMGAGIIMWGFKIFRMYLKRMEEMRSSAVAGVLRRWIERVITHPIVLLPVYIVRHIITNSRFAFHGVKVRADICHAHDLNTLLAGYLCSRLRGTRLVYDSHEVATDSAGFKGRAAFNAFLEKLLVRKADVVIATTRTRAEFMRDRYRIPLPHVVGNVVDTSQPVRKKNLREMLGLGETAKIAVYQGGLQMGRGLEQLIDAMPLVREDVVAVLIGGGSLRGELMERVRSAGLSDRVKFIDKVPLSELLDYTAGADVGLQVLQNTCFNHYSTDSNKLFEYMAVGLPVVASDFPEIRRVVDEYDAGILIDPHRSENIAAGINQLLSDEQLYRRKAVGARTTVRQHNWRTHEQALLAVYAEVEGR